MTKEARKKIGDAAKKRWAEYREQKKANGNGKSNGKAYESSTVLLGNGNSAAAPFGGETRSLQTFLETARTLGAVAATFHPQQNTVTFQF